MVKWVQENPLPTSFLATLILGLLFVSLSAFFVSLPLGFLTTGVCLVAGGHWVTYLHVNGKAAAR